MGNKTSQTLGDSSEAGQDELIAAVSKYHDLEAALELIETPILIAIGLLGFVGACFSLAIFSRERSTPNDFLIYRIISLCEAAQMLVLTIVRTSMYCQCERDYVCSFFWAHPSILVMNVCADVVDFLILFLCVERSLACLLPFAFNKVNKPRLERRAAIAAFATTFPFSAFQAFELTLIYDDQADRYRETPSEFSTTDFYSAVITANTVRFYATACGLMVATIFSVVGFSRTARRRTTLTSGDTRRESELCCLQLCTAAPVIVNHLLYAISLSFGQSSIEPELFGNSSETRADQNLDKAEAFEYLKISTNISDSLAHASQFYFYLVFCSKIRRRFLRLLKPRWDFNSRNSQRAPAVEDTPILDKDKKNNNWITKRDDFGGTTSMNFFRERIDL